MKQRITLIIVALTAISALAEGPLTPPGPPAPTMKSLQEIWDKIGGLETRTQTLQGVVSQQNVLIEEMAVQAGLSFPWQLSLPYSGLDTISHHSLAFAPDTTPAIAFSTTGLSLARLMGGSWQISPVDAPAGAGQVGAFCSLKYEPGSGKACIAYYDGVNADLKFARQNGNAWDISVVESTGDVGRSCSLAFDSAGTPVIAYYDATRGFLRTAIYNTAVAEWQFRDVTIATANDLGLSLAVGPAETGIAFISPSSAQKLRYAFLFNDRWTNQGLALGGVVPQGANLGFDAAGSPAIGAISSGLLYFYQRVGNAWELIGADYNAGSAQDMAFAFDLLKRPRFVVRGNNSKLAYSLEVKSSEISGGGGGTYISKSDLILNGSTNGVQPSLSFNLQGQPAVSFLNAGRNQLHFAIRQAGSR